MLDLAQFQARFAAAIVNEETADPLALQPGFAVYRNTSIKAAIDALLANYPTVTALLGEAAFGAVASIFAHERRPASPVLSDYGAQFPDFLAASPLGEELPYLADVARIDRLWTESFLAADAVSLSPETVIDMAGAPADGIALHPTSRHAWLDTPAATIWLAHQQTSFDEMEPEWQSEGVHVSRVEGLVSVDRVTPGEVMLLDALAAGSPFRDAADAMMRVSSAHDLRTAVARLRRRGALILTNHPGHIR